MRFSRLTFLAFFALLTTLVTAQSPATPMRITSAVDNTQLVTLHGNVPALAQAQFDQGATPPSTPMTHMRVVLSRTPAQEAALVAYMAGQQDPASPNYHKWLTPAQFGQLYGANTEDINTITGWLQSRGFVIEGADSGRMSIAFSGTVDLAENAFHTQIHQFSVNGVSFFSNITDPQIPAALAPVVVGISHLNSIQPRPTSVKGHAGMFDGNSHKFVPVNDSGAPSPELTAGGGLYLTPQDAATIYNSPISASFPGTAANNGSGVTIGIGGVALIQGSVLWNFRHLFLGQTIPAASTPTTEPCGPGEADCSGTLAVQQQGQYTFFNLDNVGVNGATDEAYIDTELSGGIAPGANIYYYASNDLDSAVQQMVYDNKVNVFSLSFGLCEQSMGVAYNAFYQGLWQQAAAQGIAVFVSTGDSGAAGCDDPNTETISTGGLAINGLASTPFNVAVGGTDYYPLVTQFNTYVNPESNAGAYYGTAKSFIPESTWNNSTSVNTLIVDNSALTNIVGGSGGISSCVNAACNAGYPKPSWQSGPGVPADGVRDIPDVSLFASNGNYGAAWLVCTDSATCALSGGSFNFSAFGGTSTSAPATAGIFALVTQKVGGNIGLPNPALYSLASGAHAASVFNDTVVGNISVPCSGPVGQCTPAAVGDFLTGYNTTVGYDTATGLGSLNITNLLTDWPATPYLATIVLTPSATVIHTTDALTVGVSVNGSAADGGAPTGTVTLTMYTYSGGTQTLVASGNDGTASFTIPASTFAAGTYQLTVTYSGDGNYNVGSASTTITVVDYTYNITASNVTLTAGATTGNTSTITVTPSGGYSGTVTWTAVVTSSPAGAVGIPTLTPSAGLVFTSASNAAQTGTVTVNSTAAYAIKAPVAGQRAGLTKTGWFTAAGGSIFASFLLFFVPRSRKWRKMMMAVFLFCAVGFVVIGCGGSSKPVAPTVSVTPSKTTFNKNTAVSFQVTIAAPAGNSSVPTGTVSLSGAGSAAITGTLANGTATINAPANTFTATGSQTITVSYSGDTKFTTASGTATVTIDPPATTAGNYVVTVTAVGTDAAATTKITTFTLTVN